MSVPPLEQFDTPSLPFYGTDTVEQSVEEPEKKASPSRSSTRVYRQKPSAALHGGTASFIA